MAAETVYAAAIVDNDMALFSFSPQLHGPGSANAGTVAAANAGIGVYFRPGGEGIPDSFDRPGENEVNKLGL